jgi:RimJ/RimL family protein N-acetyltransferase
MTALQVPASARRAPLLLRPWLAADMAALLAEMDREYPTRGLWSNHDHRSDRRDWTGPRDEQDAVEWLAGQDRGWRDGDFLTFAVLELRAPAGDNRLVGHVGLKGGGPGELVRQVDTAEISYWTAARARSRGVACAAVGAVTGWAFGSFSADGLRRIKLVHDLDNYASCRVAQKSGYPLDHTSPANPPLWFTAAHVHVRAASGA